MDRDQAIALLLTGREGVVAWNAWRESNPDTHLPDLSGVDFGRAHLENVNLSSANLKGANLEFAHLEKANLAHANLDDTNLYKAHLEEANCGHATLRAAQLAAVTLKSACLVHANLTGSVLVGANLDGANLSEGNLDEAVLIRAHLEGAYLFKATLKKADLSGAILKRADLSMANLKGACINEAHLDGTHLSNAHLEGATVRMAATDGVTLLSGIHTDMHTDFTGVGLGYVRIEPHLRSKLEYNIRRIGWNERFKRNWLAWVYPGRVLWLCDYGRSSAKIIISFLVVAFAFAFIYLYAKELQGFLPKQLRKDWIASHPDNCPEFLKGLDDTINNDHRLRPTIRFFRALYFSVVTMTTLGFGDVSAHPDSLPGHVLVMTQVILGYVLLGALITRLAILFQSVE